MPTGVRAHPPPGPPSLRRRRAPYVVLSDDRTSFFFIYRITPVFYAVNVLRLNIDGTSTDNYRRYINT
jgi:hypothetical protein